MLYLIPTPIGNTEDITLRALRLFKELKYLICEDTRMTKKLLGLYEIDYSDKEFYSLTSFTDGGKIQHFVNVMKEHDVGMVSDAGTPGLSDPGKKLIEVCNEHKLPYSVLPGANALVPAVVSAGFDTSSFVYLGFLPQKKGRQTIIKKICAGEYAAPVFFYESVHRVEKLFDQLKEFGFDGRVCVCREISKMHEQVINADIATVISALKSGEIVVKGEFVVGVKV